MIPQSLIPRYLEPRIREALADTPVVLLIGPRQAGKTTLAQQVAGAERRFLTLDDSATLLSAREDPTGFVRSLDLAVIDEVQRVPDLVLAIKQSVDLDRRPGRFLLTGSANAMMLPGVADSLAGRMETLSLLPLAGCELRGSPGHWLDRVFAGEAPRVGQDTARASTGGALVQRVLVGGYPEAVSRPTARRREAWARQYVDALIARDVRDIASVEKLDHMPRLMRALAQMAGQLCNFAELAGQVGLDAKTAAKYLGVFELMFLVRRVAPWSANRLSRVVKSPKLYFLDSGLLCSLSGLNEQVVERDRGRFGPALESYVYGELLKQSTWADDDYLIFVYRDKDRYEVDFVIEDRAGRVVGVEVKAAASVQTRHLAGIKKLAALAGPKFTAGILLYDGTETLPLGESLWAVPLCTLWET
jgi:predicted AAA+ superfamily ATPase